uniref:Uncharacterized protein n=1 Tax=Setaria italica TaxID=4555 RepID=K3ZAR7_SETIT
MEIYCTDSVFAVSSLCGSGSDPEEVDLCIGGPYWCSFSSLARRANHRCYCCTIALLVPFPAVGAAHRPYIRVLCCTRKERNRIHIIYLLKATMPKVRSIFTVLIVMLLLVSASSGMPFHTLFPLSLC